MAKIVEKIFFAYYICIKWFYDSVRNNFKQVHKINSNHKIKNRITYDFIKTVKIGQITNINLS